MGKRRRYLKLYYWKCQDCGLTWPRRRSSEPRQCPQCLSKSAKSFIREEKIFEEEFEEEGVSNFGFKGRR